MGNFNDFIAHGYEVIRELGANRGAGMSIVCWLTRTEPTEMYNIINMGTNQVMGLRELLSAYSLRFVDWLEKVVQPISISGAFALQN